MSKQKAQKSAGPAKVDAHNGFKLIYAYQNSEGVPHKTVYYGLIDGEAFYNLRFNAPQKYFSAADLATFEEFRKSFKLNGSESIDYVRSSLDD